MHPPSTRRPGRYHGSWLRSGWPRHTGEPAYRCFLPDLAGFTGSHCEGPGLRHHLPWADSTTTSLGAGIRPRYSGLRVQGTARSPSSTTETYWAMYALRCCSAPADLCRPGAIWRRGRDLNPRDRFEARLLALQASAFSHSATSPYHQRRNTGIRPDRAAGARRVLPCHYQQHRLRSVQLAERAGFEPARRGLAAYSLSRRAPSTISATSPRTTGAGTITGGGQRTPASILRTPRPTHR